MKKRARALLELMRPANIVTAFADILAGAAVAGGTAILLVQGTIPEGLGWLLLATLGLYGGGVVFNDFFDIELDALERPERPLPSGRVSRFAAGLLGSLLFLTALLSAFQVNSFAVTITMGIALCALLYDAHAKHFTFRGPLVMGLCRGGNLLLGISLLPESLFHYWPLALIPILYIGSITLISQGEVKGGSKGSGRIALTLVTGIVLLLLVLDTLPAYRLISALPFAALFAGAVLPPFYRAARDPEAHTVRKAVKRGVLSLIILNSTLAAGFAGFGTGVIILLLLPLSQLLARIFPVT